MADKTMVDYTQKLKPYLEGVAPIEPTTTAASAHAVGSIFYLNGDLVVTTTAIAIGDTIVKTEGATVGNCEDADDIVTMLAGKQSTLTFDNVPTENSNNPVKSGGIYSAEANIYEVMGEMGAKNLLPNIASSGSYASSGTVTKNANGSLTIDGTFDAVTTVNIDYLNGLTDAVFDVTDLIGTDIAVTFLDTAVSGITLQVGYFNSQGTRSSLEGVSTKADITFPAGAVKSATYLRIASGTYDNVTVYPMMQFASDKDNTYQPYAKTNKQLTAENEALKNSVGKKLTAQTLAAGSTTLTFTDDSITADSTIEVRVSVWGVYPTNVVVSAGQAVLTFEEQESAISAYIIVR